MKDLNSLIVLLSYYPAPWRVTYYEQEPHWSGPCISGVEDANGKPLWSCTTFSGDGDCVYLTVEETEALVAFVNEAAKKHES